MEIIKLDAEQYAGQKFTLRYMTNGYYDIHRTDMGFQIAYERFEKPTCNRRSPTATGAVVNGHGAVRQRPA